MSCRNCGYNNCSCNRKYVKIQHIEGHNGTNGWTAVYQFELYGEKILKKLTGYIGGTGQSPTNYIGQYVTETGYTTNKDAALNFKGEIGNPGVQGVPGPKGDKGDKGDQGQTGSQGIKGDQGVQGEVGPEGPKGDQGPQGIQGLKGDTGTVDLTDYYTKEQVNDLAPELPIDEFLVGSSTGNSSRKIQPKDLTDGIVPTANLEFFNIYTPQTGLKGYRFGTNGNAASSVVLRNGAGTTSFSIATGNDNPVLISQFIGIINDTLTGSETTTSLNILYGSAVVGTTVTVPSSLVKYQKISINLWIKQPIEII